MQEIEKNVCFFLCVCVCVFLCYLDSDMINSELSCVVFTRGGQVYLGGARNI